MVVDNAEICYFDEEPKSLTIDRHSFTRLKNFYDAVRQALINLFYCTDNNIIVVYYHGLNKSVIYYRDDVLNGVFSTKQLRKKEKANET